MNKKLKQLKFLQKNSKNIVLAAENWDSEWKILISIIMSAQSRDEITIKIANELFKEYHSLEELSQATFSDLLKVFKSLNYNKTKAKHILACSKILVNEYSGKIPKDFDLLINLPGVGRKTANVFLSELGKNNIGVDTHVFYISKKLGWTKNKNIEKIELDLKKLFPKKYWSKINPILVRFGKTHTSKRKKDLLLEKIKNL
jgi:endonuclease III